MLNLYKSKYYEWLSRYGTANCHNGSIPRDYWLEDWEKQAIIEYYLRHPLDGYRRVTYMMMDENIVAVSPATTYRVLKNADAMRRWNTQPSKKGDGFRQPAKAHQHWHVDISYINISGTFYYLCAVLDGYSRYIVHWEIRESMKEQDVEIVIQRAIERFPDAETTVISDNGSQFISRDFKDFIRISGMKHVRTSPYYPQSNGKLERFNKTVKTDCIRPKVPLTKKDAQKAVDEFVNHYNDIRLHSAIGYIAPKDKLEGRENEIFAQRDSRLQQARLSRKQRATELRKTG